MKRPKVEYKAPDLEIHFIEIALIMNWRDSTTLRATNLHLILGTLYVPLNTTRSDL